MSKCKQYSDVGYNTICHMFNSFVAPVQDYVCEIWWNSNINVCDKITERAMRYYLGVHNLTPLPALYGEMGWLRTKYRHYIHAICIDALFLLTSKRNWSYDVNKIIQLFS